MYFERGNMKSIRNFNRPAKAAQRGVSIVSVLLGLVISAGVLAVVFNQYQDSQRKSRIEAATSELRSRRRHARAELMRLVEELDTLLSQT